MVNKMSKQNKEVVNTVDQAIQQVEQVTPVVITKASVARTIFKEEMAKQSVRKDIIARLINEAGLTKNGAATYLQNMKKKAGLVKSTKVVA